MCCTCGFLASCVDLNARDEILLSFDSMCTYFKFVSRSGPVSIVHYSLFSCSIFVFIRFMLGFFLKESESVSKSKEEGTPASQLLASICGCRHDAVEKEEQQGRPIENPKKTRVKWPRCYSHVSVTSNKLMVTLRDRSPQVMAIIALSWESAQMVTSGPTCLSSNLKRR